MLRDKEVLLRQLNKQPGKVNAQQATVSNVSISSLAARAFI
jgi:hypothetical protein